MPDPDEQDRAGQSRIGVKALEKDLFFYHSSGCITAIAYWRQKFARDLEGDSPS